MWKMLLNMLIDFLLSFIKDKGIKEKDKIEVVTKPAPVLVPVNPNIVIPVEKGTVKPLLIEKFLPKNQYVNETTEKEGILYHHTVGGDTSSTYAYWAGNKEKVCTHYLIDRNGDIVQCIPLEHWGYHVYVASPGNRIPKDYKKLGSTYDKKLIGIEICNLGPVKLKDGIFYDLYNRAVPSDKVVKTDKYKGYEYWEKYTDKQIESLEWLTLYLLERFPKIKNKGVRTDYSNFVEVQQSALEFKEAISFHTSYRTDKSDIYGNPDLIKMLNNLHIKYDLPVTLP